MVEHEKKVKDLYQEYEACYTKMAQLNDDMSAHKNLLLELREQIAELKKIVILVYDTGVIEIENAEIPPVSDETVKCEFDRLISLTEAENVTIKNVKSVAKLRAMMRELPSDTEIIFDSPEMQALYEAA